MKWSIHSAKEYVRGDVHTNSIESFWSQVKRGAVIFLHLIFLSREVRISPENIPPYRMKFDLEGSRLHN